MDFYPCVCCGRVEMTPNLTLQQVVEGSHVNNLAKDYGISTFLWWHFKI
jgi:hypothetical protein